MNKQNQLAEIHNSGKSYIIYKSKKGFNLFTDFSKKILLNKNNIKSFLKKKYKKKTKTTDLFIGFFGYEILNNLINVRIPRQKNINFPKGIFYKPETNIKLSNNINYTNFKKYKNNKNFMININKKYYKKIFDKFKKKIKSGKTYQIKICTKYQNKSKIDPIDFFCRLSKTNLAPEAFLIKDKEFSIISCSPENLITKRGNYISTKPIAGTLKKTKKLNKSRALNFFNKNLKETKEHNMIVDMERSDLSKICKPGTVKISKEKYVEEYKHLFHYVTTIQGLLKNKIKVKNIIKSMMPGGSVIGCPKIRTLELLNNQEIEDRNIFTGSFGYIKFNQDMRFNIIIRSILNYKKISEVSAASGVLLDSSPKKEFNENFIKAKSLLELYK